jgi:hypothetical protein
MQWPDLEPVLSPLRWAVAGAVAARLYMPERTTRDPDIVVAVADAVVARARFTSAGFRHLGERSIGGSSWQTPTGQVVDMIEGHEPWWPQALEEAQSNRDAQRLPILPLPYLVLMKLRASRVQDLADLARMLGQANAATLTAVRKVVAAHAPDDVEDLESLVQLGKLETETA